MPLPLPTDQRAGQWTPQVTDPGRQRRSITERDIHQPPLVVRQRLERESGRSQAGERIGHGIGDEHGLIALVLNQQSGSRRAVIAKADPKGSWPSQPMAGDCNLEFPGSCGEMKTTASTTLGDANVEAKGSREGPPDLSIH